MRPPGVGTGRRDGGGCGTGTMAVRAIHRLAADIVLPGRKKTRRAGVAQGMAATGGVDHRMPGATIVGLEIDAGDSARRITSEGTGIIGDGIAWS